MAGRALLAAVAVLSLLQAASALGPAGPFLFNFSQFASSNGTSVSVAPVPDANAVAVLFEIAPCTSLETHTHPRAAEVLINLQGGPRTPISRKDRLNVLVRT